MDAYLERFVNDAMDAQVVRNGIFSHKGLISTLRGWFGLN